jgi:spore coat protein CotH
MKKIILILVVATICICTAQTVRAQAMPEFGPVFPQDEVTEVHITIDADSLAEMLENFENVHEYPAQFVFQSSSITDTMELVGLRLRGNTSLTAPKKSFKIEFDAFDGNADWFGLEKMNLVSQQNDPSMMRAKICHDAFRAFGIANARTSFTRLYINEEYMGLYLNIEQIDEEFAELYFDQQGDGNVYKCTWPASFEFLGNSQQSYQEAPPGERTYDLQNNLWRDDYSKLVNLIDVINNTPDNDILCMLPKYFNIEDYITIAAIDILFGNWDNHIFLKNNFYLYEDELTGQTRFIPYDLDNSLGLDWLGIDWAQRDIYNWQWDGETRPLYQLILETPEYRNRFNEQIEHVCETYFNQSNIAQKIDYWKSLIGESLESDTYYPQNFGFTYNDFLVSDNEAFGGHVMYGIISYVNARRASALTQLESYSTTDLHVHWIAQKPNITGLMIEAKITGSQAAQCQLQLSANGTDWTNYALSDGPGPGMITGDQVYTYVGTYPNSTQEKIYYRILQPDNSTYPCEPRFLWNNALNSGLVINEVVISNSSGYPDESGQFEDWVELYNNTSSPISLAGKSLTDDIENPDRFILPALNVPPYGFRLVWLDRDMFDGNMHGTFRLSEGESVYLFNLQEGEPRLSDVSGPIFTPINYAWERTTDGGPIWAETSSPTPLQPNTMVNVEESSDKHFRIFPNPADEILNFQETQDSVRLYDAAGRMVIEKQNCKTLYVKDFESGFYIIQSGEHRQSFLIRH